MAWPGWLIVSFLVLVFFIFILMVPVTFLICFSCRGEECSLEIKVNALPIPLYRKINTFPLGKSWPDFRKSKNFSARKMQMLKALFIFLMRRAKMKRVSWETRIGTSDAFYSALAAGWLWGIKGFLLTALYRYSNSRDSRPPQMRVTPVFNLVVFDTQFKTVFQLRIIDFVLAGSKLIFVFFI
jgi:hypothetical protein